MPAERDDLNALDRCLHQRLLEAFDRDPNSLEVLRPPSAPLRPRQLA